MSPLIRHTRWEKIRVHFSDSEKRRLNAAICGQAVCPPGIIVDLDKLPRKLLQKLEREINAT